MWREQWHEPAPLPVPFVSLGLPTLQAHHMPLASVRLFIPFPQTPPPLQRAKVCLVTLNSTSPEDFSTYSSYFTM